MKSKAGRFIALRYLLGRGREGGRYLRGAAIGIALSLIPIVITLVVADGMIQGITWRFLELGTGHIQVFPRKTGEDILETLEICKQVDKVLDAWLERTSLGILVGKKGKSGANVRAVQKDWLANPRNASWLVLIDGDLDTFSPDSAVIGQGLAEKLGISVGDRVRLMTTKSWQGGRLSPTLSSYVVCAIVSSGYRELDELWFFINWETGLQKLSENTSRSFIRLRIEKPLSEAEEVANILLSKLPKSWTAMTWYELQTNQYESYASTRQLLLFIMSLIVLIAAVNVSSSTAMLSLERRRDIAILKSFGASASEIEHIFIWAAFLAGAIGTIIGIGSGLLISSQINNIINTAEKVFNCVAAFFAGIFKQGWENIDFLDPNYYLDTIPIVIDWFLIGCIALATVLCSVLSAWAPARRAARLLPLDILRKY